MVSCSLHASPLLQTSTVPKKYDMNHKLSHIHHLKFSSIHIKNIRNKPEKLIISLTQYIQNTFVKLI